MKLHESILLNRKKINMTKGELANKTSTTENTVTQWENGEATPSIDSIKIIAKVLNVNVYKLMDVQEPIIKRAIHYIGKLFFYLFIWIHIDITIGFVLTSLTITMALLAVLTGIGGGISLIILGSIYDVWSSYKVIFIILLFITSPLLLLVFGSVAFVLFKLIRILYNFSLKYFWNISYVIPDLTIPKNKSFWTIFLILSFVGLVLLSIFFIVMASNGAWNALDWNLTK